MEAREAEDPAVRGLTDWLLRRRQRAVQISVFIPVIFRIFTSQSGDFQVMLEGFLEFPGKISESGAPLQRVRHVGTPFYILGFWKALLDKRPYRKGENYQQSRTPVSI